MQSVRQHIGVNAFFFFLAAMERSQSRLPTAPKQSQSQSRSPTATKRSRSRSQSVARSVSSLADTVVAVLQVSQQRAGVGGRSLQVAVEL